MSHRDQNSEDKMKLPIGISDFKELREKHYYYVDKTMFIHECIESSAKVILLPRPRRFGKTLNLSMLKCFFEKRDEDVKQLFKDTEIVKTDVFEKHQGKYPVIFLTFKDLKDTSWNSLSMRLIKLIRDEYARHEAILKSEKFSESERYDFEMFLKGKVELPHYADSLRYLSRYLSLCYQKSVLILIDEYDTPLNAGYLHGYYEEIVNFMRNLLSGGLKDNTNLHQGIVTGVLRVAKESIFSGLNNLAVYTMMNQKFSDGFGFTEIQVEKILHDFGMSQKYNEISTWYNGYNFAGITIYNPWSILNYVDNKGELQLYWINTADNAFIDRLATQSGKELREEVGQLLEGKTIVRPIFDTIALRDLDVRDDLLWSFLLFSGYLKSVKRLDIETCELTIPNQEVRLIYRNMVRRWFVEKIESAKIENLLHALLSGDFETFEDLLTDTVEKVLSYHDTIGPEPEKFYHAFVLGLLVWLEGKYQIKSNRESGLGRYDVMLIPNDRDQKGIIIEFKKVNERRNETPEKALEKAIEQIEKMKYGTELKSAGIKDIVKIAVAFRGKELWVKEGI